MSHPKLSFPDLRSLKMYRSIWKAFFVLFFKPCLSTCFCLFKYSYCFYLILSHLTYKRKQMCMQTEIIISLMYSLILRETLLCWLWMPWLRNSPSQNRQSLSSQMCSWFGCVCVCTVCLIERNIWERRRKEKERMPQVLYLLFTLVFLHFSWLLWMSNWNQIIQGWHALADQSVSALAKRIFI